MVDSTSRRDCGRELCDGGSDESVVDTGGDEFVQNTWWTTVDFLLLVQAW